MKKLILLLLLIPNFLLADGKCNYELLVDKYPDLYKKIVKKTNKADKLFTFCAEEKYYLLNSGELAKGFEGGKFPGQMEFDLYRYLLQEYDANSYTRTALMVDENNDIALETFIINKGDGALGIVQNIKIDENAKQRIVFGESKTYKSNDKKRLLWGNLFTKSELSTQQIEYLSTLKKFVFPLDLEELDNK